MGQTATRALASGEAEQTPEQAQAKPNGVFDEMAERPPLQCVFYYESRVKSVSLAMPLVFKGNVGTLLVELERRLRIEFGVPEGSSVFGVVPAEELYSPPFPLVMLNVVAAQIYERFERDRVPVLHFALVVRTMDQLKRPLARDDANESPFFAVPAAALSSQSDGIARSLARRRLVQNLQRFGFARLEVTPEQAAQAQEGFRSVRKWLSDQLELPSEQRWRDLVDTRAAGDEDPLAKSHPIVSRGRRVGFSSDRNREYLQLRQPIAASGTVWPPRYFADKDDADRQFAEQMLALVQLLDDLARDCMRAVCELLNLDERWLVDELLDDRTQPPSPEDEVTSAKDPSYQYGASVLRVYNYRNKAASQLPRDEDYSCGVHADLGLVTVSPVATVPGLQMWNLERMLWSDVEEDASPLHFSVFAGETLSFLTHGLISAPLHRVPAICVDSEEQRRMSMPYFLRVRPDKCLNPKADPALQITCRDFMEDVVFKKRPWRRDDKSGAPPDY